MIVEVLLVINSQNLLAPTHILRVFCIISKNSIHLVNCHAGVKVCKTYSIQNRWNLNIISNTSSMMFDTPCLMDPACGLKAELARFSIILVFKASSPFLKVATALDGY